MSISQRDVVVLKSFGEIGVHLHDYRPHSRVEFTQATRGCVGVTKCGGGQGTKDLGLAPDAVRAKAINLIGVLSERPDAEVSKWRDGLIAGRGMGVMVTLV